MKLIEARKTCKCKHGCNIYTGNDKYIIDGKTYCMMHGRAKSLLITLKISIGRQLRDSMAQANAVQKKWMTTITEWAMNGGLRLLYGDEWEFAEFERHHVLGRSAKHNKISIGHEFILPVPYKLHNIKEKNDLNVSYFKHNFTDKFGKQTQLFEKMILDMIDQEYAIPDLQTYKAIMDTNA